MAARWVGILLTLSLVSGYTKPKGGFHSAGKQSDNDHMTAADYQKHIWGTSLELLPLGEPKRPIDWCPDAKDAIVGKFVIRLQDDIDEVTHNNIRRQLAAAQSQGSDILQRLDVVYGSRVQLKAIAARLSDELVNEVRKLVAVRDVVQDFLVKEESVGSWGLDRIDQAAGLDGSYNLPAGVDGSGVYVFVLDTGVLTRHQDFGGRATEGHSAYNSGDANGHGTHCAGTVGGTKYGVAPKANLVGLKVLGDDGKGSYSAIAESINWLITEKRQGKYKGKPCVASMSLGGPAHSKQDEMVQRMVAAGIVVIVAAGNEKQDACNRSPAREPLAITVGSTNRNDKQSWFSNYGRCVDIYAPGTDIVSASNEDSRGTKTLSGTSMACPHVSGAAALYLQRYPTASVKEVEKALLAATIRNSITLERDDNDPNLLLNVNKLIGGGGSTPVPPPPSPPSGTEPGDGMTDPPGCTRDRNGAVKACLEWSLFGSSLPSSICANPDQDPAGDWCFWGTGRNSDNQYTEWGRCTTCPSTTPSPPAPAPMPTPPAPIPTPPTPTPPAPVPTPPSPPSSSLLRQYATGAKASSEYSPSTYSAMRATGAPDVGSCQDHQNAWSPQSSLEQDNWLEVTFDTPVYPSEIRIWETNKGPFVTGVLVRSNTETTATSIFDASKDGADPTGKCSRGGPAQVFVLDATKHRSRINVIRISTRASGWEQIDAVQLMGTTGYPVPTPTPPSPPSVPTPPAPVPAPLPAPSPSAPSEPVHSGTQLTISFSGATIVCWTTLGTTPKCDGDTRCTSGIRSYGYKVIITVNRDMHVMGIGCAKDKIFSVYERKMTLITSSAASLPPPPTGKDTGCTKFSHYPCKPWAEMGETYKAIKGSGCANPDNDAMGPWCFWGTGRDVFGRYNQWESCVDDCGAVDAGPLRCRSQTDRTDCICDAECEWCPASGGCHPRGSVTRGRCSRLATGTVCKVVGQSTKAGAGEENETTAAGTSGVAAAYLVLAAVGGLVMGVIVTALAFIAKTRR